MEVGKALEGWRALVGGPGAGPYVAMSLAWAGVTAGAALLFPAGPAWSAALVVLVFAIPLGLSGAYGGTVRRIRRRAIFSAGGRLHSLLSGRLLSAAWWTVAALAMAFFVLVQMRFWTRLEWSAYLLTIPVYWLVFSASRRVLAREVRWPYLVTGLALAWARWLCPVLMLGAYALLLGAFGEARPHASLEEAVDAVRAGADGEAGSALVAEAHYLAGFLEGARAYVAGGLGTIDSLLPLLVSLAGGFVVFLGASAAQSAFAIPSAELRRVFGELSEDDVPPPVDPARVAATSAVVTIVALFVLVPLFAKLETLALLARPEIRKAEARVEQIDEAFFRPGTLAGIAQARAQALSRVDVSLARLDGQVDAAFARMEGQVDGFLDWYYSLPAEYGRILAMLAGNAEKHLEDRLAEHLRRDDLFAGVARALREAIESHEAAAAEFDAQVRRLLDGNRLAAAPGASRVTQRASLAPLLALPGREELVAVEARLLGGSAAAALAAVATAKVIGKVVGKGALGLAAKALGKVAASKASGVAAGALVGGIAGSVVPGFGTAIGAAAGGALGGLVVGVAVDRLLLLLEEQFSRAQFREQLLSGIREAKDEFKRSLRGPATAGALAPPPAPPRPGKP